MHNQAILPAFCRRISSKFCYRTKTPLCWRVICKVCIHDRNYNYRTLSNAIPFIDRADFTLGSLSMMVKHSLPGYEPIPDYPEEQPDPSVRDVEEDFWNSVSQSRVIEQGFGSDSFESRYRNGSGRASPSTAFSGVEARGFSVIHSQTPKAKKVGDDYDLDAFYNDTSDEDEDESSAESDETSSEEESEDGSSGEEEETSEEESSDDLDAVTEKRPLRR